MSSPELELGPVDIVVIGFPADAPRTGEAIPLFLDLVDRGIIRVLDVLIVRKDAQGNVDALDLGDLEGDHVTYLGVFEGARTGLLGEQDAETAGESLTPEELAVLICIENTWAAPFVTTVRRNGGELLAFQRIPAQEVVETVEALEQAESAS